MFSHIVDYKNLDAKILEDSNKVAMLIFLYVEGRSKKSDIYKHMVRSDRLHRKLNELESVGWVQMEHKPFENNVTYVELTDLGHQVAKKLMDIENLMKGNPPDLPEEDKQNCSAPSEEEGVR